MPPPWLEVARSEFGVATMPEGQSHPRVEEYHRTVTDRGWNDKVPWCSSFLNWCFLRAGIPGTNSGLARSWLNWGTALETPRVGCLVILWRDDPASEKGHAGFFLRQDEARVYLWGGNQLGAVCENSYPREMILGFRWPPEVVLAD